MVCALSDMSDKTTLFELKEKAKWSRDSEEKKTAIKELSTYGQNAISELQEIMNITAFEDIKEACAEAIKSIQTRSKVEVSEISSTIKSNSTADVTTTAKDQKKEEKFEKEAEGAGETGVKLADLPP
jgi:S-adenosylmethionine synthetase